MDALHLFEQATRLGLRFDSTRGALSTEDLWNLPLEATGTRPSLDSIAVGLHAQLHNAPSIASFVTPSKDAGNSELQLKFDVVKRILDVRLREREELKAASDRREKKQRILELIARKQDEELGQKSVDELRQLAESL